MLDSTVHCPTKYLPGTSHQTRSSGLQRQKSVPPGVAVINHLNARPLMFKAAITKSTAMPGYQRYALIAHQLPQISLRTPPLLDR
jgi:hypothetical protein